MWTFPSTFPFFLSLPPSLTFQGKKGGNWETVEGPTKKVREMCSPLSQQTLAVETWNSKLLPAISSFCILAEILLTATKSLTCGYVFAEKAEVRVDHVMVVIRNVITSESRDTRRQPLEAIKESYASNTSRTVNWMQPNWNRKHLATQKVHSVT